MTSKDQIYVEALRDVLQTARREGLKEEITRVEISPGTESFAVHFLSRESKRGALTHFEYEYDVGLKGCIRTLPERK